MKTIPILFFHINHCDYLEKALRQAKRYNNRVILLGDMSNKSCADIAEVEFHLYSDYANLEGDLEYFNKSYKHLSSNSADFEYMCFARWFVMKNFIAKNDLDECFYIDSDIMLYCDITERVKSFKNVDSAFLYPYEQLSYRYGASGHSSYWTRSALAEYCSFVNDTYITPEGQTKLAEKWNHHRSNNIPGGICDMSLFYLYYNYKNGHNIVLLNEVLDESTFDDNINSAENRYKNEYRMKQNSLGTFKEIMWKDDIPFCYNLRDEKWVKFNTLHFQGISGKSYMKFLESNK